MTNIKVVQVSNDAKKFEEETNKANAEVKGWATHTHVTPVAGNVLYTAVIFYGAK